MAMRLASAFVDIGSRDKKLKEGLAQSKRTVRDNVASMQNMLASAGVSLTGGGLLGFGVKMAAQAETARTAFDVIIKDTEKTTALLKKLDQFSVKTPFTPAEVRKAGQSLLAFRNTAKEIPDVLQMLGDAASGSNSELNELTRVFNKTKSVGKLTGETFEQFAERGVNLQAAITEMLGISGAEFVKMRAKGEISFDLVRKAMAKMTSEGGIFFNAMAKQSTTVKGLWSTLQGVGGKLGEIVGNVLLPPLKFVTAQFIKLGNAFMVANEASGGMLGQVTALTIGLGTLIGVMIAAKMAGITFAGAMRVALMASGVGILIVGLSAIVVGIIKARAAMKDLSSVSVEWREAIVRINDAWNTMQEAFSTIGQAVMDAIGGLSETLFGVQLSLSDVGTEAKGMFFNMLNAVTEFVQGAAEWFLVLVNNWRTALAILGQGAIVLGNRLLDIFTVTIPKIFGLFVNLMSSIVELFKKIPQVIQQVISGKSISDAIFDARDEVREKFSKKIAEDFKGAFGPSDRSKRELAQLGRLFGELNAEKEKLEAKRPEVTLPEKKAEVAQKKKTAASTAAATDKAVTVKAGMFGFGDLQKSFQEAFLKQKDPQAKLVKLGEQQKGLQEKQLTALEKIAEKPALPNATT